MWISLSLVLLFLFCLESSITPLIPSLTSRYDLVWDPSPRISSLLKARKVREGSSESSAGVAEDSSAVTLANNALALTANYSTAIVENSVKKSSIST